MRTLVTVIATLAAASLSSCSSSQQTANAYTDDVYYSAGTPKAETPATVNNTPAAGQSDYASNEQGPATSSDENRFDYQSDGSSASQSGNTYVTNNYYNDDDYYDYAYTARIRRFYRPMWGYGYYDSYYTNSYWYDYNPYNWGVSIYCGYNWWAPSFWYAPTFTYFSWGYNPYNYWWSYPSYGYYPSYYYGWNNYNYMVTGMVTTTATGTDIWMDTITDIMATILITSTVMIITAITTTYYIEDVAVQGSNHHYTPPAVLPILTTEHYQAM